MLKMRHLYIRIYAFITMLAIFFIVGMFVFHIIDDTNKEIENSEITFRKFEKAVAYEVKRNLLEDDLSKQRLKSVAKVLGLKGFVIQITPTDGKVFSYPSDSSLFTIVNGNVLIKEHSKFLKVFKTDGYTATDDVQKKIYLTVMLSVFPSEMVFVRSRTVFFFALTLVLLTGLIRILLSVKPSEKVERVYTSFNERPESVKYSTCSYEASSSSLNDFDTAFNVANDETYIDLQQPKQEDDFSNDVLSDNVLSVTRDSSSSIPFSSSNEDTALNDEPRGLYSPTTGFCWQGYLIERLDSEIRRATSTDQDMSFVIIKIQDVDFPSLNMKSLSKILLEAFSFRDMIFEYSDDISLGYAVILQDMYIDEALKICDVLFSKIKNEIYLTGQQATIGIGITTRACRLVDVKTILSEAEGAVSRGLKAKNDPIVGFRPNAEKYRQQTIEGRD